MPVPEAAVDENHRPVLRQHDVRTPRQPPDMYPVTEPPGEKKFPDDKLRLRVAPAYPRHAAVPLLWSQFVSHIRFLSFPMRRYNIPPTFPSPSVFLSPQAADSIRAKTFFACRQNLIKMRQKAPAILTLCGHEANNRLRANSAEPTALALSFSSESTMPPLGYIRFSV